MVEIGGGAGNRRDGEAGFLVFPDLPDDPFRGLAGADDDHLPGEQLLFQHEIIERSPHEQARADDEVAPPEGGGGDDHRRADRVEPGEKDAAHAEGLHHTEKGVGGGARLAQVVQVEKIQGQLEDEGDGHGPQRILGRGDEKDPPTGKENEYAEDTGKNQHPLAKKEQDLADRVVFVEQCRHV